MANVGAAEKVSVVIVSYNTRDLLQRCIESIDPECEIIVVDNASTDGTLEMLEEMPNVRVIANKENRGFGAANNQGIRAAKRPLILLLNSDAAATEEAITDMAFMFENEWVVAVGGRLVNPDGTLQESCANKLTLWAVFCEQLWLEKLFRSSTTFSPYWMSRKLIATGEGPFRVAQVMGACLMFRPVEKFDERFFMYCEDTELCARLLRHGSILYMPEAMFYHDLGSSSKDLRWKAVAYYNCGKELYFEIERGVFASLVCWFLDSIGALLRFLVWSILTLLTLFMYKKARVNAAGFFRVLFAPRSYEKLKAK